MSFNKITLSGNIVCDYIYIQQNAPNETDFSYVDDEPKEWSEETTLFADFNSTKHPLSAGDSSLIGAIEGYEIRRQKEGEAFSEYVGVVSSNEDSATNNFIVDFATKNKNKYSYYLYPNNKTSQSGTLLSPIVTQEVFTDSPFWSLLIVDETEEENVFYLNKMFKFELNLQVGDMSNNAQISITPNFTKYPTVQYGNANFWSGSLTALSGFISSNNVEYVQTANMINELKGKTSDTRKKFLKDIEGNIWEVAVSAPISISTDNTTIQRVKNLSFSWVEVGEAKEISIINNPNSSIYEWIITEDGNVVPYFTYMWDEQYKLSSSCVWTANENSSLAEMSNMGRKISSIEQRV